MICLDGLVSSINPTVPGPSVASLQARDVEAVRRRFKPNPAWVNEKCGTKFLSVYRNPTVCDCTQGRARSEI